MKTYSIKVALRGISPMIWRRLEINSNTTLADLHHIIQIAMNWDNAFRGPLEETPNRPNLSGLFN
ncbi:MAG: hypothetical protein JKY67_03230 [Pseudomonadales bacterium]|nr:hypothetical protein [Pseudomonadales bacterium]